MRGSPSIAVSEPAARRRAVVVALIGTALACAGGATMARSPRGGSPVDSDGAMSLQVRAMLAWIEGSGDNEGAPFAVIDKQRAHLWLFDGQRRLAGHSPVLLGLAAGDASVPGIGERPMAQIARHERTTPAGRFRTWAGRNADGEDVFWVDYDAAVSMHRVRATNAAERRLQRLASPSSADNRISYGCINVPARFYDERIRALFANARGVVYLLPEKVPFASLFVSGPTGGARPVKRSPGRLS